MAVDTGSWLGFAMVQKKACGASGGLIAKEWRFSRFTLNSMLPTWSLPGRKSPLPT